MVRCAPGATSVPFIFFFGTFSLLMSLAIITCVFCHRAPTSVLYVGVMQLSSSSFSSLVAWKNEDTLLPVLSEKELSFIILFFFLLHFFYYQDIEKTQADKKCLG